MTHGIGFDVIMIHFTIFAIIESEIRQKKIGKKGIHTRKK